MTRKGEFNVQGMIISMLIASLFFALVGIFITMNAPNYDIEGFELTDIQKYDKMRNLSEVIKQTEEKVDQITIDRNVFDFFADIFSRILSPFKFIYRSFRTLVSLSTSVTEDLKLLPVIGEFFASLITVLVIIGLVMIKYYMNKQK